MNMTFKVLITVAVASAFGLVAPATAAEAPVHVTSAHVTTVTTVHGGIGALANSGN